MFFPDLFRDESRTIVSPSKRPRSCSGVEHSTSSARAFVNTKIAIARVQIQRVFPRIRQFSTSIFDRPRPRPRVDDEDIQIARALSLARDRSIDERHGATRTFERSRDERCVVRRQARSRARVSRTRAKRTRRRRDAREGRDRVARERRERTRRRRSRWATSASSARECNRNWWMKGCCAARA